LGKYHSAIADTDAYADAVTDCNAVGLRVTGSVAECHVRVSDSIAERMSKAFTREETDGPDIPDLPPLTSALAPGARNYITAAGAQKLREELQQLVEIARPRLSDAQDDPDAKRQLARLDQRIMQLEESLQSAEVVAPPAGPADVVRFGATVKVRESDGAEVSYRIVGVDEIDLDRGWVSWLSPIAKALVNGKRGQRIHFKFPSGEETLEIVDIRYE
jgi:transcription elongation factor GreB